MQSIILILIICGFLSCKKSQVNNEVKSVDSDKNSEYIYTAKYNPRLDSIEVSCLAANCPKNFGGQRTMDNVSNFNKGGSLIMFLLSGTNVSNTQWSDIRNDDGFRKFQSLKAKQVKLQKYIQTSGGKSSELEKLTAIENQLKQLSNISKYQDFQSKIESATYTARVWLDRMIRAKELYLDSKFDYVGSAKGLPPAEFSRFIAKQLSTVK